MSVAEYLMFSPGKARVRIFPRAACFNSPIRVNPERILAWRALSHSMSRMVVLGNGRLLTKDRLAVTLGYIHGV